ncbi:EF-P 5-aminopentanol modification-associated protein YfmH [Caproicibacterium sp. XB1]|uniref:EF-P 5-aminopentanol modification-associated protein YfmH n=1 Tax=Caproicibacterium sp. XB1 TaxID=3396405 RepID=UPI0039B6EFE6
MSGLQEVKISCMGESYLEMRHSSGLHIMIYPKPQSHTSYAVFGTNYGSIDNVFRRSDEAEPTRVPEGIAHYLEHKMFENADGVDAFAKYAKTGANANAYTSFDKTCYLFSCTDHVYESLEILLDFVQKPYFTEQTVQKEQGIIGQEIRMYEDDPGWRVLFNMLSAMYKNHPVKLDIAGTVESIAKITPELLYECHKTFYNLNNMVLCVVGNVEPQKVLALCDKLLQPSQEVQVQRIFEPEPQGILKNRVSEKGSVAVPVFYLGFKAPAERRASTPELAQIEVLLEALCGESSPLFRRLLDAGLINESSFGNDYFEGPGYAAVVFSGESKDPDAVAAEIQKELAAVRKNGLDPALFADAKKSVYGQAVSGFNSVENLATSMLSAYFAGRSIADDVESIAQITLQDLQERLRVQMLPENAVLSVIHP